MAKSNFNIALASRSQGKLEDVKAEILDHHPDRQVKVIPVDLSKPSDYVKLTHDIDLFSNLGMIVNNAGQMHFYGFLDQKPETIQTQHVLNMYAITLLTKYSRMAFQAQGKGKGVLPKCWFKKGQKAAGEGEQAGEEKKVHKKISREEKMEMR